MINLFRRLFAQKCPSDFPPSFEVSLILKPPYSVRGLYNSGFLNLLNQRKMFILILNFWPKNASDVTWLRFNPRSGYPEIAQKAIEGANVTCWNMLHIICIWFWNGSTIEPFSFSLIFAQNIDHVLFSWDGSLFLARKSWDSSKFEEKLNSRQNDSNFEPSQNHMHLPTCDISSYDGFLSYFRIPPVLPSSGRISVNLIWVQTNSTIAFFTHTFFASYSTGLKLYFPSVDRIFQTKIKK